MFIVLIFFLLSQPAFSQHLDKPWEKPGWSQSNQYIISVPWIGLELWDNKVFDESISSLGLDDLQASNELVQKKLESAEKAEAKLNDASEACAWVKENYWELQPVPILREILLLEKGMRCLEYGTHWRATMNNAIDAIEISMQQADDEWENARAKFEIIRNAGLCNDSYSGAGKDKCDELKDIFYSIDHNLSTGRGGSYVQARDAFVQLAVDLKDEAPQTGRYKGLFESLWADNGVIASAAQLTKEAADALEDAEFDYKIKKEETEQKLKKIRGRLAAIEKEDIEEIRQAAYFKGVLLPKSGQRLNDRLSALRVQVANAGNELIIINIIHSEKRPGYLSDSYNRLEALSASIINADEEISALQTDAQEVVDGKRADALAEISSFESLTKGALLTDDVKKMYNDAKNEIESGDRSTSLGDRFSHYAEAEKKVRLARAAFNKMPAETIASLEASIKRLEKLIADAKTDGIDTTSEELSFALIKMNKQAWADADLSSIEKGLVQKAAAKWGFLERLRKKLLTELQLGGPSLNDIKGEVESAEGDAFGPDGRLRLPEAIGRLKYIHAAYLKAENDITTAERKAIALNGLITSKSLFIGDVELDKPTEIMLKIFLRNRYPYSADDVELKIENKVELLEADILEGGELLNGISQSGRTLTLYLKRIEPYGQYNFAFGKEQVVAHIIGSSTTAYGRSDGSAEVAESIEFELDYDVDSFSFPASGSVLIDGLPFRRTVAAGKHTLTHDYVVDDAFTIETANYNAMELGFTTTVRYDIVIVPAIDLAAVQLFVEKPEGTGSFTVGSLGWEKITEKTDIGNGMYSFKILKLKKNRETRVRVSYSVKNTTSYINSQLELLSKVNLSEKAQDAYDGALTALSLNDTSTAIEKIEEAKKIEEGENRKKEKAQRVYDKLFEEVTSESEIIGAAITELTATGITDEFVGLLKGRADVLDEALEKAANANVEDGISQLQGVEKGWLKKELANLRKRIFSEYSKDKAAFLSLSNNLTAPFYDFETAYAKFLASNSLSDVPALLAASENVKAELAAVRATDAEKREALSERFSMLKSNITKLLNRYEIEKKAAQGSHFISLFTEDEKAIKKRLKGVEEALKSNRPTDELKKLVGELDDDAAALDKVMALLRDEAKRAIDGVEAAYTRSTDLSDASKNAIEREFNAAKSALAAGNYVDSLKASEKAFAVLQQPPHEDYSTLILGFAALLVLGILTIYIIRYAKKGEGEKKTFRKLERAEETVSKFS